ncbi:monooxygenase [Acinetobacter shaoyimingii]|uniref:Monooxygenase n=1 Tax=Acinetobacter shaoyimingii TaxID=2715164 RepID=A0A6G8RZT5_9GAMM|nr:monooxygenase [Acinetobacter shaoyimingii]NHB59427.1 monooxygenase [Acinetobacter shaoyimingii]QIO07374.1 monooxygenase [Acinetobacter shaoyimingii]
MASILQIDFPYVGPWGAEMFEMFRSLAESISNEKGLIWKIWTENQERQEAGGIYLFERQIDAEAYLDMHVRRLEKNGFHDLRYRIFDIHSKLSEITNAPV